MKKHLTLGIVLSLVSASVQGKPTTDQTGTTRSSADVFLSSPSHSFEIEGSALYLQPTGSNLHYAAEAQPLPILTPQWKIHEISTDYHFGFDVGIRGIFHESNTNLSLSWEHFHSSDSAKRTVPPTDMIGPFFEIGPDASFFQKAHGHATFHFDQGNLDYGIYINFGSRLETNVYAGVSVARIAQTVSSKFSSLDGTTTRSLKIPSTYLGAGPQLGLDFDYRIVNGFHFSGEASASLFVGTQKNHTKYRTVSPALAGLGIAVNHQKTSVHKKTQVVPALEGKLGLSYFYTTCNFMFKIEAGYQAQVYFSAIQSTNMGSEVLLPPITPNTTGVYARTFEPETSNFALAGPYLMIDFGF
ncbi:MAG TPA: Lpg1974 family pore-forming outer membrane protein [Rhabdochlamydiaceae bacterium]